MRLTVALAVGLGATALTTTSLAAEPRDGPVLPTHQIILGSDEDRPGVGVQVVEEVSRPGTPGRPGNESRPAGQQQPSSRPSAPAAPARPTTCVVWDAPWVLAWWGNQIEGEQPVEEMGSGDLVTGRVYYRECRYVDDGTVASYDRFVHQPGTPAPAVEATEAVAPTPPDVETIARQLYAEIPLAVPVPHTSPPPDAPQLVGFPMWMWVDDAVWRSFDAGVSVSGISVSVVARPETIEWDLGDGTVRICEGPGTAWNPNGGSGQATDCSHTYQFVSADEPGGRYRASVTVTWSVTWSASTGESGTLPSASRSADFSLLVTERQAVIHRGT